MVARQVYSVNPVVSKILTRKFEEAARDAQTSRWQYLALADDILVNSGSIAQLGVKVYKLYRNYTAQVLDL